MSRLLVLKFGGHALANPARVRIAARRIAAWRRRGVRIVAVASAPAGLTDRLLASAARVTSPAAHRELDRLLATGEDRSTALLALRSRRSASRRRAFVAPRRASRPAAPSARET
jgi:aspartate kinase